MRKTIADMKMQPLRRRMAAVAVLTLAATTMIGVTSASAAALTNTTWSVSNNQIGSTAVTYTFELTTATAGTIGSVTATVPTGTAGTVDVGTVYGLGAGTVALSETTLTYTVTTPRCPSRPSRRQSPPQPGHQQPAGRRPRGCG